MREEKKGPRVDAPEAAINGFVKSAGLASIAEAERREDKKGAFYVALIEKRGRPAAEVVAEIVPEIVSNFPWPKSMRWGSGKLRWVRPLHSILCLLDGKVVPFEVDGIRSGKETCGHRFMAPKPFAVKGFADYVKKLRAAKVILDGEERAKLILDGARILAKKEKLALVEDDGLLQENVGLTEWPVPLIGAFDEEFLSVPAEVLATAMKAHQKCFSLRKGETARQPLHHGGEPEGEGRRRGDRRRQRARDQGKACRCQSSSSIRTARRFCPTACPSSRKSPSTKSSDRNISGCNASGSSRARLRLASAPIPILPSARRSWPRPISSASMVGEFPELQGVMGRYYALDQEENPSVADAIAAHYKPLGPSDEVPREPVAISVALADKLDALMGFWAIDEKPTGSKDPYALRRAALGVIRIVLEDKLRLHLLEMLEKHAPKVDQALATNVGGAIGHGMVIGWTASPRKER